VRRPPQEMIPQALTRVDYRRCMYACLTDPSRSC
jgi:hypothetical protein